MPKFDLAVYSLPFTVISVFIILVIDLALASFMIYQKTKREGLAKIETEDLSEKINILQEALRLEGMRLKSYLVKLDRYDSLRAMVDKLNRNLSLEDTAAAIIRESLRLFNDPPDCSGILYLVDQQNYTLSILSSYRPADSPVIKAKNGDIYDRWTLRNGMPLLIEDTACDFRFDPNKSMRSIGSLISSPLLSQQRVAGIIRLDSLLKKAFALEDLRLLSSAADIASVAIDNALYYKRTQELAIRDTLTGLYLRNYLQQRFEEELKRCISNEKPLSILMIDIDHFKNYNDRYGHLAGDIVLRSLGVLAREYSDGLDSILGRFGGEEFLIILPFIGKDSAYTLAENMRSLIQIKEIMLRRKATHITVSIGVACFPLDASTVSDLLEKADRALYEAKHRGRNRVCLA